MTASTRTLGSGLGGFASGVGAVFAGLSRLLRESRMRRLALVPMAMSVVAYLGAIVSLAIFSDDILGLAWAQPAEGWLLYAWYVLVPIVFLAATVVLLLLFLTVANLVAGPFWEKMALLVLKDYGVPAKDAGLVKGTVFELVRGLCFFFPAVICALIGFIPVVGLPFTIMGTAAVWLGFASWAINPTLIATGHSLKQQLGYVFVSPMVMAGVGTVIGLSLLVPVLGLVSLPSAMIGVTELYAKTESSG